METNIMCWCSANKGKHGLQKVQSVLMPKNYYYLECGCIYQYFHDTKEFKLIRHHTQRCNNCRKNVDRVMVIQSEKEIWCTGCAKSRSGTFKEYRHNNIPEFFNGYEVQWKDMNDNEKLERDRLSEKKNSVSSS